MNEKSASSESKKKWRRIAKRAILIVTLGMIMAGVGVAAMPKPIEVETAQVKKGELVVTIDEDGTSRVRDRYVVSAPLAGNLARIELQTGDEVKQGQVLARILPVNSPLLDTRTRSEAEARVSAALAGVRQSDAQIERAKAAAEYASQEAKDTEKLAASKTVSAHELTRARLEERSAQAELTSVEFSAKVARHQLAMARSALGRLNQKSPDESEQFEVTSPSAGRVLKIFQQSEGVVGAGSQLLEIGDPKALEVAVDVLTSDAVSVKVGAPVSLEHWGGASLDGSVRLIEPSAFTRLSALGVEEQRVNAIIEITSPYESWKPLGDGYRVEAKVETYRNSSALLAPWSALFRQGGGWAVFVREGDRAKRRKVEVGRRNDTNVEVLSGLKAGELVIVHPSDKISDGAEVTSSL